MFFVSYDTLGDISKVKCHGTYAEALDYLLARAHHNGYSNGVWGEDGKLKTNLAATGRNAEIYSSEHDFLTNIRQADIDVFSKTLRLLADAIDEQIVF